MNITWDKDGKEYGLILPPRCATRWVGGLLHSLGRRKEERSPHNFDLNIFGDRDIIMMCRHPFYRLRSLYRWYALHNKNHDLEFLSFFDYCKSIDEYYYWEKKNGNTMFIYNDFKNHGIMDSGREVNPRIIQNPLHMYHTWEANELPFDIEKDVTHFIKLEEVNKRFKEILDVDLPEYDNGYHDDMDGIDDEEIKKDPYIRDFVTRAYSEDFRILGYSYDDYS